jgi:hypothetical protein
VPNNRTRKKRRPPWESKFLEALSSEPNIAGACRTAEIGRTTAYDHRHADPEFAAAWQEALDESVDELVGSCYRRAMKDSDTLAIFLLKCHRPEVYGDRQQTDLRVSAAPDFLAALDRAYGDEPAPEESSA